MTIFYSNILNIYDEKGESWLDELPELVAVISSRLGLRDLKEIANLTHNYVLSGFQRDNPIILKLGLDSESLAREALALKCFAGYGAVNLLAEDDGMLLLGQAVPGTSLKCYFPNQEHESIEIVCEVIRRLHQASIPKHHNFPHVKDWLMVLNDDLNIPDNYLQKARKLRDQLLQTAKPDVLLHGDLHQDNILQNSSAWLVIDPKGVIGEPAYEIAAFIRNPIPELLNHAEAPNVIRSRIIHSAKMMALPSQRIVDWCFVQAVLAWAWSLEDGCDAEYWKRLVRVLSSCSIG
jgi:streptomycin 6-kinase